MLRKIWQFFRKVGYILHFLRSVAKFRQIFIKIERKQLLKMANLLKTNSGKHEMLKDEYS